MSLDGIVQWGHLLALDYNGRSDLKPDLFLGPVENEVGAFYTPLTTVRDLEEWMGRMVLYCQAQRERLK